MTGLTALPPSLPPTRDDLRLAIGDPVEGKWIEGDHPTDNPDGVTHSNVDYWPKTQEEKAEGLGVDMVEVLDIDPAAEYPSGAPPGEAEREEMLARLHTPNELVPGPDRPAMIERSLRAGGREVVDGAA